MSVCVRLCFIFKDLAFFPELFHDACFPPTCSNDSMQAQSPASGASPLFVTFAGIGSSDSCQRQLEHRLG